MTSDRMIENMSRVVNVRICWVLPQAGGRDKPPPGPNYSTVARFKDLKDKWPEEAWSIVAHFAGPPDESGCITSELRLLSEDGPVHLLYPGSQFELFEGRRLVATGEVLC
jgi:hypothetical protein